MDCFGLWERSRTFSNESNKVQTNQSRFQPQLSTTIGCVRTHASIIGSKLFSSLALAFAQQQAKRGKFVNNTDNFICKVDQAIASSFPDLVSRNRLSKTNVVRSEFHQKVTGKHQKGPGVPSKLKARVTANLDWFRLNGGNIEKLSSCSNKKFNLPIVITVKKD